jgi:hypothetical protein
MDSRTVIAALLDLNLLTTGQLSSLRQGSQWKHTNGNEYTVIAIANYESMNSEYPPQIVYVGRNGRWWTKPIINFLEKMTPIPYYARTPQPSSEGESIRDSGNSPKAESNAERSPVRA